MLLQRDSRLLLAEDPELGSAIPTDQLALAARACEVEVLTLAPGRWRPARHETEQSGHLGFLVLGGVVARRVMAAARPSCELLGDGDLLRPASASAGLASTGETVTWSILEETTLAVLDARSAERMQRWPQIGEALLERAVGRSNSLAQQLAILSAHPVEQRLLLMLWHLAERWGRVCREGVRLPLPLTHGLLAEMCGVRRPSLSTAVGHLAADNRLARPDGGRGWLLIGGPPLDDLDDIVELAGEATA
jgi:hypothetical protein